MQECLSGMTNSQFSGIIDRLTTFTSQNLKKLISHMNLDAFFANVDKVAVSQFTCILVDKVAVS